MQADFFCFLGGGDVFRLAATSGALRRHFLWIQQQLTMSEMTATRSCLLFFGREDKK